MSKKIFKFYADILKSEGTENTDFYVEGYASTSNLDRQGDIIILDALKDAAKELVNVNNTVFYGHSYDLSNAVGRIVEASVDDIGLKVKIFVSSWAKELRTKLKEGIINKFSIGGKVVDDETISKEEAIRRGLVDNNCPFDKIHVIKKLELYEVSFVGVPANPEAQVLSLVKALENLYKGGEDMKERKDLEQEKIEQKQEEEKKEQEQPKAEEKKEQKEEFSEEEIKDLLEESKDEEENKPYDYYYYYYGKEIHEKLDKLGEAIAEISKKLDELIELIKEKVKTIEVIAEKKSVIKKEDIKKEEKKENEEDVDELFLKFLKKRK